MEPGRGLDALIAEKIFEQPSIEVPSDRPVTATELTDREVRLALILPYSTDISAAWPIVEKFKNEGNYKLVISAYPKDEVWTIKAYHREGYSKSCSTSAETLPHAICLAALKAVGYPIHPAE